MIFCNDGCINIDEIPSDFEDDEEDNDNDYSDSESCEYRLTSTLFPKLNLLCLISIIISTAAEFHESSEASFSEGEKEEEDGATKIKENHDTELAEEEKSKGLRVCERGTEEDDDLFFPHFYFLFILFRRSRGSYFRRGE